MKMKNHTILELSALLLLTACSSQFHSYRKVPEDVYWGRDYGYQLKDGSHSIYYVDSISCPQKFHLLYSDYSGYSYFSIDSVDVTKLKEPDILANNVANLMVKTISFEFGYRDERKLQLFGHDEVEKLTCVWNESGRYGMCEFMYERRPSHFRILLIRGDYLNGALHRYIQDGRFSKLPVQIIDPYAYYKVYVPIWE